MCAYEVLKQRALGLIFVIFAATLQVSVGMSDDCSDGTCGASGTVLLKVDSTMKRVAWPQAEADVQDADGALLVQAVSGTIGEPIALPDLSMATARSETTEGARLQALASLEYDSFDDDGISARGYELEFVDDKEHSTDSFNEYAESQGYSEKNDVSFSPAVWNSAPEVRASHNCYMYALNDLSPRSGNYCKQTHKLVDEGRLVAAKKDLPKVCKRFFHKPGYYFQNFVTGRAQTDVWLRDETTCHMMLPMIAADSPAIVWNNEKNTSLTEDDSCPKSHYMAALFIQPKAGFHFYRRDHACSDDPKKLCWSHKPGILEATTKDAKGKVITSVLQADRNYGELNYSEHCAFFCVPQNKQARTHSDAKRSSKKL